MPPFHRSLVFWVGLLVVAFLLVAGYDSLKTRRQWMLGLSSSSQLEITNSAALLHVSHHLKSHASASRLETRYFQSPVRTTYSTWFPAPWIGRRVDIVWDTPWSTLVRGASLPHGLLVALFVPPWILLAVRRAKRIAKLRGAMEENVEPALRRVS